LVQRLVKSIKGDESIESFNNDAFIEDSGEFNGVDHRAEFRAEADFGDRGAEESEESGSFLGELKEQLVNSSRELLGDFLVFLESFESVVNDSYDTCDEVEALGVEEKSVFGVVVLVLDIQIFQVFVIFSIDFFEDRVETFLDDGFDLSDQIDPGGDDVLGDDLAEFGASDEVDDVVSGRADEFVVSSLFVLDLEEISLNGVLFQEEGERDFGQRDQGLDFE